MSEALSEPQNLVVFQLLHEVGKTPGMFASREEVLNGNPQYLREEHEVFVVHKTQSCFDLRNAAAADVETGELKFCGEHRLRPAEGVASAADLGTNVVVEPHFASPGQAASRSVVSKLTRGALALWQSLISLFASVFGSNAAATRLAFFLRRSWRFSGTLP
jgi:hypothetical protein